MTRAYGLPTDPSEHDRLTLQHEMWKLMIGGLYPIEAADIIESQLAASSDPLIIDLGTGSGVWAAEMAYKFPQAKVLGLDQAPPTLMPNLDNCSFVVKDLAKGLDDYEGMFDLVHCRCVAGHLQDRPAFVQVVLKILKPGGILVLSDGNKGIFSVDTRLRIPAADPNSTPPQPITGDGSWASFWLEYVVGHMLNATLDPEHAGGETLLWHLEKEADFEILGEMDFLSPLREAKVPRDGDESLDSITARNIIDFLSSTKPILLADGVDEVTVNEWQRRARYDIGLASSKWALKWNVIWARKIGDN